MRAARRPRARGRGALLAAADLLAAAVAAAALAGGGEPAAPVASAGGGCPQRLSPRIAQRVPALSGARVVPLAPAARAALDERSWPVDHVQDGQAQLLSADGDMRFWVVPVVAHGGRCTPADGACVIAAHATGPADAHCAWGSEPLPGYRISTLAGEEIVLGIADPLVSAIRVRLHGEWAGIPALGGVVASRVPLWPGLGSVAEPEAPSLPRVAVVDATGGDRESIAAIRADLRAWGYPIVARVIRGDPPLAPPEVRWRAGLTDRAAAERLARRIGTTAVRRIADRSVGGAPLILVAGVG